MSLEMIMSVVTEMDIVSTGTILFVMFSFLLPSVHAVFAPQNKISHPADIYLPNRCSIRPAAMDTTVISPLQQQVIPVATKNLDRALQVRQERKLVSSAEAHPLVGINFFPLVVEALGG